MVGVSSGVVVSARATNERLLTRLFVVGGAALCALVAWAAHDGLIDDAYITLSYAKNLATEFHWGLTLAQESNTATAPGNVLLIAAATALLSLTGGLHPVLGLGLVSVFCGGVLGWSLARVALRARLPWPTLATGGALVVLNPLVLSAIGLEVLPVAAALALLLAAAVEGRPVLFGVAAGATMLLRLDLLVFVVVMALGVPEIRNRWTRVLPGLSVVGLPWYIWAWFHFGSAVPDTLVIKTLQRSFDGVTFLDGPLSMLQGQPLMAVVAFVPAAVAVVLTIVALVGRTEGMSPAITLGLAGIVYFLVYAKLHVPPYHWYFVPSIVSLVLAGTVLTARWATPAKKGAGERPGRRHGLRVLLPAGAFLGVALVASSVLAVDRGVPWQTTQLFGNWAVAGDYARVAEGLRARVGDAVVRNPYEIGQLAYFCDCAMVNDFTDRGVMVPLVQKRYDQAGPIAKQLLRINYHFFDRTRGPLPAAYELHYDLGPGSGPDTWQVWAPNRGFGHMTLVALR